MQLLTMNYSWRFVLLLMILEPLFIMYLYKLVHVINENSKNRVAIISGRKHDSREFYTNTSVFSKGTPIWKINELWNNFDEFDKNFALKDNDGGMRAGHQYGIYSIIKILQPKIVIESGVWRGKTSQLIRRTTDSKLISVTPEVPLNQVTDQECICGKNFLDFNKLRRRWEQIEDKSSALIIFDDHQSGIRRLREAYKFGFKHIIIDDNYFNGDNFSPKLLFRKKPTVDTRVNDNFGRNSSIITPSEWQSIFDEMIDIIDIYTEFPPLNKHMAIMFFLRNIPVGEDYHERYQQWSDVVAEGLGLPVNNIEEYSRYNYLAYIRLK